jgi:hypothetical protein
VAVSIEKVWDGKGRWQWVMRVNGEVESTHDTKGAAQGHSAHLAQLRGEALQAAEQQHRLYPSPETQQTLNVAFDAAAALSPAPKKGHRRRMS